MAIVRHDPFIQTLGTFQELERRQQYDPMNHEGFDYWWQRMSNQLCKALIDQLNKMDQDDKPFEDRYLFNAKVIIPFAMRDFIDTLHEPTKFLRKYVEQLLRERIETIIIDQVLRADSTNLIVFLVLEGIVKKNTTLDYDLAGVHLSGNHRKIYPYFDKEPSGGGASYKKDVYPNMPESNARMCKWGVYWRRLRDDGQNIIDL